MVEDVRRNRSGTAAVTTAMTIRRGLALTLILMFAAGCAGASIGASPTSVPNPSKAGEKSGIAGVATAGPVCPVEKNPPDPACAPRPVDGAVLVFHGAAGTSSHHSQQRACSERRARSP